VAPGASPIPEEICSTNSLPLMDDEACSSQKVSKECTDGRAQECIADVSTACQLARKDSQSPSSPSGAECQQQEVHRLRNCQ
jgi:hypothetical protein